MTGISAKVRGGHLEFYTSPTVTGVDLSWTVPQGQVWRLLAAGFTLATSSVAGSREIRFWASNDATEALGGAICQVIAEAAQAPSTSEVYHYGLRLDYSKQRPLFSTFPISSVVDNFNRADATPISGSWAQGPLFFGTNDVLRIASNQCAPHATPTTAANGYYNGANYGPDLDLYTTIAVKGTSFMNMFYRLVNIGSGTSDGYYIAVDASVNQISIVRLDNGSGTTISSVVNQTITNGDLVGVRCVGSLHELWYKAGASAWAQATTVTDATYGAAGRIGYAFADATWRHDDIAAGAAGTSFPLAHDQGLFNIYLPPGHRIRTQVLNIDAGDQLSNGWIYVESYPTLVPGWPNKPAKFVLGP